MADFKIVNGEAIVGGLTIVPFEIELTVDVNDLSIADGSSHQSLLKLTNATGGNINITGIEAEDDGHFIFVHNRASSTGNVTLKHNDVNSADGNRFLTFTGNDLTIQPGVRYPFAYLDGAWSGPGNP